MRYFLFSQSPHSCSPSRIAMVSLALFGAVALAAPAAVACTCDPKPELQQALDDAALVFVGRVTGKSTNPLRPEEQEVKFTVSRKLKGFEEVPGATVLIYTPKDYEYCGYRFGDGLDYLVFASGNPAHFKTTSCNSTNVLENAMTDVQKLIRITGATPAVAPAN